MAEQRPPLDFCTVELTPDVQVRTSMPPSCHPALRAGFSGYTDNPRWTPIKRRAWKQGKQWRDELANKQLEVRDGLLLTSETVATLAPHSSPTTIEEHRGNVFQGLLNWSRKKPVIS